MFFAKIDAILYDRISWLCIQLLLLLLKWKKRSASYKEREFHPLHFCFTASSWREIVAKASILSISFCYFLWNFIFAHSQVNCCFSQSIVFVHWILDNRYFLIFRCILMLNCSCILYLNYALAPCIQKQIKPNTKTGSCKSWI